MVYLLKFRYVDASLRFPVMACYDHGSKLLPRLPVLAVLSGAWLKGVCVHSGDHVATNDWEITSMNPGANRHHP